MAANQADQSRDAIERSLDKLDKVSKQYNLTHDDKGKKMRKLISQIVKKVDALDDSKTDSKAQAFCWKGRAYGSLSEYSKEAEDFLTKAIKLEPTNVDAWNALGTEYWKKKDLRAAGDCFRGALDQNKNKISYRKLSMVVRNFGEPKTYRVRLEESISLAKKAIALDVSDSESWYILGNAYMTTFFSTFSTSDLEGCLKAYEKSEKMHKLGSSSKGGAADDKSSCTNPDLYYNRANVHKFYEQFQEAIDGYRNAKQLDPHLPGQDEIDNIHRFVKKLSKLVRTKNGLKAKKLLKFSAQIPPSVEIKDSKRVELKQLEIGENKDKFVVGTMIAPVTRSESVPVSFIVMDKNTDMFVVSIYGVIASLINDIKVGDVLFINKPILRKISVKEFKERSYPCIMVPNAATLSVNGHALPKKAFAKPVVRVETYGTALTKEGKIASNKNKIKS